jgi:Na+-driven multidrug efflux pump
VFGLLMMAFGFGTTLIVPVVFGRLSTSAVAICWNMVMLMALFMPVWVYMNTQQAVARAGGDTAMGAYADSLLTLFVMIPMVILLGRYTEVGPVWMYGCVKLIDLIK